MRDLFTADWSFAMVGLIETNVRHYFPQLLRSWPLLQSFNSEAYLLPHNYVLFILRDKLRGTPAGPSQPKPFPHDSHPPVPPSPADIPVWQFFVREKFGLQPSDASFLVPGHDCGRNDAAADYDLFSIEEKYFWSCQLQFILNQHRQWLESIMKSSDASNITYNVSGINARINVDSTDMSSNTLAQGNSQVFAQLRDAFPNVSSAEKRLQLAQAIDQMESSATGGGFLQSYKEFIALAADHIGVFGPAIGALAAMLA